MQQSPLTVRSFELLSFGFTIPGNTQDAGGCETGMAGWTQWFTRRRGRSFRHPKRLGDLLCEAGIVARDTIDRALERQQETGLRLGHILVSWGDLDEEALADFLSDRYGLPSILVSPQTMSEDVVGLLPREWMEEGELVPVRRTDDSITIAMVDPGQPEIVKRIEKLLSLEVRPVVAPQSTVAETLNMLRRGEKSAESFFDGPPEEREALGRLFSTLDDYEVVGVLGKGGFATVFKCYQKSLDRLVAIKTVFKKNVPYQPIFERFMREGKVIAKLDHLNIVRVIEQGETREIFFIVMEYVEGETLDNAADARSLREKLDLFVQICDAFAYSHEAGVLHRDIKPTNILVDRNGIAKILDFGIAYVEGYKGDGHSGDTDFVMGTPRYMAPEQRETPDSIDPRADLYSLAAVMFEVFSQSRRRARFDVDLSEANPEVPVPLARAISKCLSPDREDRLSSLATLKEFLTQLRNRLFEPNRPIEESLSTVDAGTSGDLFKERYELISELKNIQECHVFLAEHKERHQLVLFRQVQGNQGFTEAKILSHHKHPNIGQILGVGEGGANYVMIREYLDGGSLWDRMKQPSRLAGAQAVRTLNEVAQALDFAQGYKVFHGHLHPENILFTRDNELKVVDFSGPVTCGPPMRRFFEKGPRDPHALDRFSLGVFLFEMLARRQYFPSQGPDENFEFIRDARVGPPELKRLLRKLWGLVPRDERYSDHKGLLEDIEILSRRIGGDLRRRQAPFTDSSRNLSTVTDTLASESEPPLDRKGVFGLFGKKD